MDRRRLLQSGSPGESSDRGLNRPPGGERRLVVLASGNGSNLQAIISATASGALNADVVAVVTNVASAFALDRARSASIATEVVERNAGEPRHVYDQRLADIVAPYRPDFVVLAGWMRLLTANFLDRFAVVNLHPALPGEFPGLHAIERALADARAGRRSHTGAMVHFVPDEGVDDGPVIATVDVPIEPDDDLATLTARMHSAEHRLLIDALSELCTRAADDDSDAQDQQRQPNHPQPARSLS